MFCSHLSNTKNEIFNKVQVRTPSILTPPTHLESQQSVLSQIESNTRHLAPSLLETIVRDALTDIRHDVKHMVNPQPPPSPNSLTPRLAKSQRLLVFPNHKNYKKIRYPSRQTRPPSARRIGQFRFHCQQPILISESRGAFIRRTQGVIIGIASMIDSRRFGSRQGMAVVFFHILFCG